MKRFFALALAGLLLLACAGCGGNASLEPDTTTTQEVPTETTFAYETFPVPENTTIEEPRSELVPNEPTAKHTTVAPTTTRKTLLEFDPAIGPGPLSVNELAGRFGEPRLPGMSRALSRNPTLAVVFEGVQFELIAPETEWCYEPAQADRALPMKLYSVIVSGEKFSLPHGIRIGDSMEKVRAAFSAPPYAEPETHGGGMRLVYRYPDYDLGYTFDDGRLTYLLVVWDHLIY